MDINILELGSIQFEQVVYTVRILQKNNSDNKVPKKVTVRILQKNNNDNKVPKKVTVRILKKNTIVSTSCMQ